MNSLNTTRVTNEQSDISWLLEQMRLGKANTEEAVKHISNEVNEYDQAIERALEETDRAIQAVKVRILEAKRSMSSLDRLHKANMRTLQEKEGVAEKTGKLMQEKLALAIEELSQAKVEQQRPIVHVRYQCFRCGDSYN